MSELAIENLSTSYAARSERASGGSGAQERSALRHFPTLCQRQSSAAPLVPRYESEPLASKRTAPTEERYKPYDLEFAALKFGLDHFSNTIWGFPVEVKTDCRAMKDTLCNNALNLHHARWKEGIQGYNLTTIRHQSGESNKAADALSCMYTGKERTTDNGSTWLVCEDWEASRGLVNDLFGVHTDEVISSLCKRFTDEPLFLEVVQAITNRDSHRTKRERNRAKRRAEGYHI